MTEFFISGFLFITVVNGPGQFAFQVLPFDDSINKTVFQKKFTGLKTFWKLDSDCCFDCSWTGETDQGFGFGENQIPQKRETRGHPPHGGVGQNGNKESA